MESFEDTIENFVKVDSTVLLGSGKQYSFNDEEQILGYVGNCLSYKKMTYKNVRYTTKNYCDNLKINDSIVETHSGKIGVISNICSINVDNEIKIVVFYHLIEKLL